LPFPLSLSKAEILLQALLREKLRNLQTFIPDFLLQTFTPETPETPGKSVEILDLPVGLPRLV
jgi:hypothetical protein